MKGSRDSRKLSDVERLAKQERVVEHIRNGHNEQAVGMCLEMLDEDYNDPAALFQLSKVMLDQGHHGISFNLMARATKLEPDIPEMWVQFAQCHSQDPDGWRKAEWCYRKGIKLSEKAGKQIPNAWSSIGAAKYLQGEYDEAEKCLTEALRIQDDLNHALTSLSFVYLAQGRWDEAWVLYDRMLGGKREAYGFQGEPEWDGSLGKSIIITGEQGIGDELMYASCFNEVIEDSESVVIECMPRLEALFKRSFPKARAVYGTRWDKEVVWEEDYKLEGHVAMASIPRFYRHKDEDFPGKPYLTPNPDMVAAVRGIFEDLGDRPKIGLAWTGGSPTTRGHLRERTLEELLPILRVPDVDFISLEYYNRDLEIAELNEKRGIPIHTFHWLTARGLDYDLTAALISQLDLVISVPTTTVQAAGALGVEAWVIVPKYTGWMFCRDTYPWASSVKHFRNPPMKDIERRLREWLKKREKKVA